MPAHSQITPYVTNAINLNQVSNEIVATAGEIYFDASKEILNEFREVAGSDTEKMAWLNAQARQIRGTLQTANNAAYKEVIDDLTGVIKNQTRFQAKQLKAQTKGAGVSVRTVEVGKDYLTALATGKTEIQIKQRGIDITRALPRILPDEEKPLKELFGDLLGTSYNNLTKGIRSGLLLGKPTDEIVKGLIGGNKIPKDSPLKKTERALEQVVRTSVTGVSAEAQLLTLEANKDITEKYQFLATLDSRTSLQCANQDQRIYQVADTSAPRPPLHRNCRSTIVPYLADFYKENGIDPPGGTRASANGQVDGDENYETWLRRQPEKFQNKALGKGRADLFRSGMALPQMLREDGGRLTIKELNALTAQSTAGDFDRNQSLDNLLATGDRFVVEHPEFFEGLEEAANAYDLYDAKLDELTAINRRVDAYREKGEEPPKKLLKQQSSTLKEAERLEKIYEKVEEENKAGKLIEDLTNRGRKAAQRKNYSDDHVHIIEETFYDFEVEEIQEAVTDYLDLIGGIKRNNLPKQVGRDVHEDLNFWRNPTRGRAYANAQGTLDYYARTMDVEGYTTFNSGEVSLGRGDDYKRIIFHEASHHLEVRNPDYMRAAEDFVKRRSGNSEPVQMADSAPGELAYKGDFIDEYVGKAYYSSKDDSYFGNKQTKGSELWATEALSMGVERFSDPDELAKFYDKDPEHFKFILGVILTNHERSIY